MNYKLVTLLATAIVLVGAGGKSVHKWAHREGKKVVSRSADWQIPTEPSIPRLHVDTVVEHGDIVEIKGTAEPGAAVMINGEPAALVFENSGFRHFVGPLRAGLTIVTITAQSASGGVNTQQVAVQLSGL